MSKRDERDVADALLAKAVGDEAGLRALTDHHDVPDHVAGFLARPRLRRHVGPQRRAHAQRRGQAAPPPAQGRRLPVYCTAVGKVLLASLPRFEQDALLGELTLERHTTNTITSKTELRAELKAMAEQGIAVNDQELTLGQSAIAAPARD